MKSKLLFAFSILFFVLIAFFLSRLEFGQPDFFLTGAGSKYLLAKSPQEEDNEVLSELPVISKVIGYINTRYFDQSRVHPKKMLVKALKTLQLEIVEVMVKILGDEKDPDSVIVRAGKNSQEFDISKLKDTYQLNWFLIDIFNFIRKNVPKESIPKYIEYDVASAMVKTLDPHSSVLDPDEYGEMKVGTFGRFGGLGIVISIRKGKLTIISVMDDTPAKAAGLKKGDHITQIEDESTINMSLSEAVSRMRGKPGTKVTIWIMRKGFKKPKRFTITRAIIRVKSVLYKKLENNVLYIKIKNFNSSCTRWVKRAIKSVKGKLKGVILDLRGNPGGLLSQARGVSDIFLKEGVIVTTVGKNNKNRNVRTADNDGFIGEDVPVVVLVDSDSASASEIVAGALKYNNRAIIMGEQTFGKATVQELYDILDGALKITIAQYLTPHDILIQNVGIIPDVELFKVKIKEGENELYRNEILKYGEKDLPERLEGNESVKDKPVLTIKYIEKEKKKKKKDLDDYDKIVIDYPINFASKLISRYGSVNKKVFLKRSMAYLKKEKSVQDKIIAERLREQNISWEKLIPVSHPKLQFSIKTDKKDNVVQAEDDFKIIVTVKNVGELPVSRIHLITKSKWYLLKNKEIIIGTLKSGEEKSSYVKISVPENIDSRYERIKFLVYQDYDKIKEYEPALDITFKGKEPPEFAIFSVPMGKKQPLFYFDEDIVFKTEVLNISKVEIKDLQIRLKNLNKKKVLLKKGRYEKENVKPGEVVKTEFEAHLNDHSFKEELKFKLSAIDTVTGEYISTVLKIPPFTKEIMGEVSSEAGKIEVTEDATLYMYPFENTYHIGTLKKHSILHFIARTKDFYYVLLSADDFAGWIKKKSATPTDKKGDVYKFDINFPFYPPQINVTSNIPLHFKRSNPLKLQGEVKFTNVRNGEKLDVYIYLNKDKIFFHSKKGNLSNTDFINFNVDVFFKKGNNKIYIYARQGKDFKKVKLFHVFYDVGED